MAAGWYHNNALKSDGTVVTWGIYGGEQSPPTGLRDVTAIAAGRMHNLALKRDGSVVGWGENYEGQISQIASLHHVVALDVSKNGFSAAAVVSSGSRSALDRRTEFAEHRHSAAHIAQRQRRRTGCGGVRCAAGLIKRRRGRADISHASLHSEEDGLV